MCGIVGILGNGSVAEPVINALRLLEYRGYDSAGIATLEGGRLSRRRASGKLVNLEEKLKRQPLRGHVGIGHTRWATHGRPSESNAHPHSGKHSAVVHNGIIENFRELRDELGLAGRRFRSETDSEVIVHLVDIEIEGGRGPIEAVRHALLRLKGAFALVFLFSGEEDLLVAARRNSPLAIGYGEGEMFIGSDALALAPFTKSISYLADGDVAAISRQKVSIFDERGIIVSRPIIDVGPSSFVAERGPYNHFMAKEIAEQPEVVARTLGDFIDMPNGQMLPFELPFDAGAINRVSISACGTAFYAGLTAKYWFERFAQIPVDVDLASEFRYREPPLGEGNLAIFVSQSGETADTLASLRFAKENRQHVVAVVNVATSSIARESFPVLTRAGPEIGVASTKAFTCQLAALASLAITIGRRRGSLSFLDEQRLVRGLISIPAHMAEALKLDTEVRDIARQFAKYRDVLYLGRGTSYPLALEGALKLKEISYIHAEGYAAGELKHGPIALIEKGTPVVIIAPFDRVFEKTISNLQEVAARGARILLLTDALGAHAAGKANVWKTLILPTMSASFTPLVYAVPLQLLAYHTAVAKGTDVDRPRNLAKSVTVE